MNIVVLFFVVIFIIVGVVGAYTHSDLKKKEFWLYLLCVFIPISLIGIIKMNLQSGLTGGAIATFVVAYGTWTTRMYYQSAKKLESKYKGRFRK